jgi:hypothetical protein
MGNAIKLFPSLRRARALLLLQCWRPGIIANFLHQGYELCFCFHYHDSNFLLTHQPTCIFKPNELYLTNKQSRLHLRAREEREMRWRKEGDPHSRVATRAYEISSPFHPLLLLL